jgi:hypothetical protein
MLFMAARAISAISASGREKRSGSVAMSSASRETLAGAASPEPDACAVAAAGDVGTAMLGWRSPE